MKISDVYCIVSSLHKTDKIFSERCSMLSYAAGQYLNCDAKEKELLWFAGALIPCYEPCKRGFKFYTLKYPTDLSLCYTTIAAAIVNNFQHRGFGPVAKIIAQVEENEDGSGQPKGLKGSQINVLSKIVRLSVEYYKQRSNKLSHKDTADYLITNIGTKFSEELVEPFLESVIKNELHRDYRQT